MHCCNEIISDVFVREKKDGTHRMILNLKNLNQHANKLHFKMDTLNTITKLVDKDCFMAFIDLKDAYYYVPKAAPYRKYLSALHLKGHISSGYIDDLYLQGATYKDCVHNVIDTLHQIDSLGLIAHPDKSVFNLSQQLVILGFVLNSVAMTVVLTLEKALALQHACQALLTTALPTMRGVTCVLGKIVCSFPGVMYDPLNYH